MNQLWLCNDVWMDILPSFDHAELGLKMALLSPRFNSLVDKHFDGKSELTIWRPITICKRSARISELRIWRPFAEVPKIANSGPFPLPDCPLPNKIRFKDLRINYIDHSVLTFIRSNKPIWDRNGTNFALDVCLHTTDKQKQQHIWNVFVREIWPLFAASIRHLSIYDAGHLDNLRRLISPAILTDLDQLSSIDSGYLLPDGIANDGRMGTAGQALSKWLNTPKKNGQPKRLHCSVHFYYQMTWLNNFKETFLRATTSVAYNVRLKLVVASEISLVEPFELVNKVTQEKLTLRKEEDIIYCLLKRCPIVRETATVLQENDGNLDNLNGVIIRLYKNCIGLLDAVSPGPSDH